MKVQPSKKVRKKSKKEEKGRIGGLKKGKGGAILSVKFVVIPLNLQGEVVMEAKELSKVFEPKIEVFDAFSVPFTGAEKSAEEIKPVEACCACTACTACTACG